jgi:Sulfotransferase domain
VLVVAAGMPKSGTGWWFNVHNDLLVAAGHSDVREVRERFGLGDTLQHHNCLIARTRARDLLPLMRPALAGHSFVVKTHAAPTRALKWLLAIPACRATFLYRDPRDAALSAFEHGERARREGGSGSFTHLTSLESAIEFIAGEVVVAEAWMACPRVLAQRYEDLLADPHREAERLLAFLGITLGSDALRAVLERTHRVARSGAEGWKQLHFNVGEVGRYRATMPPRALALAEQRFGPFLRRWGYAA